MPATSARSDPTQSQQLGEMVCTSLALGWQMARLYEGQLSSNSEPKLEDDLPGLSAFPAAALVSLGLAQADVALAGLRAFLGDRASLPTTDTVREEIAKDDPDADAIRRAILDLHIALLSDLMAADFRLGKAYGLGRGLADTCASRRADDAKRLKLLEHQLERHRALEIVGWLDDLKTVLPPHAGQAVADSLQRWARWAQATDLATLDEKTVKHTRYVLHRCGQRWRALLTGEKEAHDILQTGDYVSAARNTLVRAGAIARAVAWQLKWLLVLAGILIAVGITLMLHERSPAQVIAGLGTLAGGLGITWRGAAGTVGRLSLDLGSPLWQTEIDVVIANRLTPPPQRDFTQAEQLRGRLRRAWRQLRTADPDAPLGGTPSAQKTPEPPVQEAKDRVAAVDGRPPAQVGED
jgi:hypothetical protein